MYLAIDTSSDWAGLALVHDGQVLVELGWHIGSNHSVELLPHLKALLEQGKIDIKAIAGIIVARGPGSFNGLRVGLGTAKGLSFSLGVPIVGVSTLEVSAYVLAGAGLPVCPVLSAGRGEVAWAVYQLKGGEWQNTMPEGVTTVAELCSKINHKTVFGGEPTPSILREIQERLGDKAVIPSAAARLRRAGILAELGEKRLLADHADDASSLQPIYLRRPQITQPRTRSAGAKTVAPQPHLAVIWDMDGVIVNSAPYHLKAWQETLARRGVAFGPEDFKRSFGLRNDDIIKSFLGSTATSEEIIVIGREKEKLFRDMVAERSLKPLPGAVTLISALRQCGIRMTLVSSAPQPNIALILKTLGLSSCFQAVVSAEDVERGKPDPQVFLVATERLGAKPECCVVIEDAPAGIEAAKRAGMKAVGVTTSHRRLSLGQADLVVDSLEELSTQDIEKLVSRS